MAKMKAMNMPFLPAEVSADQDQESRQQTEQDGSLERIHGVASSIEIRR